MSVPRDSQNLVQFQTNLRPDTIEDIATLAELYGFPKAQLVRFLLNLAIHELALSFAGHESFDAVTLKTPPDAGRVARTILVGHDG